MKNKSEILEKLTPILRPFLASWPVLVLGLFVGIAVAAVFQARAPIVYTAEALVARADAALYEAKRDRVPVVVAQDPDADKRRS